MKTLFRSPFRAIRPLTWIAAAALAGTPAPALARAPLEGCLAWVEDAVKEPGYGTAQSIISRYKMFSPTTEAQNDAFIRAMDHDSAGRLHFDIDLTILKELNDRILEDKDLATAATNWYKALFFQNLEQQLSNHPELLSRLKARYSDYKAMRLLFDTGGRGNEQEIMTLVRRAYAKANVEYEGLLSRSELSKKYEGARGIAGTPESWHTLGYGPTADEATQVGRTARSLFVEGEQIPAVDLKSRIRVPVRKDGKVIGSRIDSIENILNQRLVSIRQVQNYLQVQILRRPGLLGRRPPIVVDAGGGMLAPSAHLIEVFRKADPSDLDTYTFDILAKLREKFGLRLDLSNPADTNFLAAARRYYSEVDGFGAGLYSSKRRVPNFEGSSEVFSVDLAMLGAKNIEQTGIELLRARDARDAIRGAREAEKRVTYIKQAKVERVLEAVENIFGRGAIREDNFFASGDDIIFLPKPRRVPPLSSDPIFTMAGQDVVIRPEVKAQWAKEIANLAEPGEAAGFRTTILSNFYEGTRTRIPDNERSALVVVAEKVEKRLRQKLEKLTADHPEIKGQLQNVVTAIDFTPALVREHGGSMRLILGGHPEPAPNVRTLVELAFDQAIREAGPGYRNRSGQPYPPSRSSSSLRSAPSSGRSTSPPHRP